MVINIDGFNSQISDIKNSIKDYEINIYESLSIAKNISYYWKDGYTPAFFKKIDDILQNTNELVNSLYRFSTVLQSISSQYNAINNERGYLLGHGGSTINSNYYIVQSGDDENVASCKRRIYNSIQNAENNIASLLSGCSIPYVSKIDFGDLEKQSAKGNDFVGMLNNIPDELNILEQKNVDAKNSSNNVKNIIDDIPSLYQSSNSSKIAGQINEIKEALYAIDENLRNACDYIRMRREKYKEAISKIAEEIRNTPEV